mmetsp:Transcript_65546/g.211402  ORF Transcript_65546/g.211402 Transcript_65546/m.211402 type:complete len:208 (-) Transcript_65546:2851-3474(-)
MAVHAAAQGVGLQLEAVLALHVADALLAPRLDALGAAKAPDGGHVMVLLQCVRVAGHRLACCLPGPLAVGHAAEPLLLPQAEAQLALGLAVPERRLPAGPAGDGLGTHRLDARVVVHNAEVLRVCARWHLALPLDHLGVLCIGRHDPAAGALAAPLVARRVLEPVALSRLHLADGLGAAQAAAAAAGVLPLEAAGHVARAGLREDLG